MSTSYASKTHDVFISFRGEDTRFNFTCHLHKALCNKQIETYIDYNLKKGDDVWPALAKAIEDSHVSIVVFSENYATSKWCLDELVKILECKKDKGQVVIPVFYRIDPSHIRKHTGPYGEAFAKHEQDLVNQHKVSKWKSALTKAANIFGWDSRTHRLSESIHSGTYGKAFAKHEQDLVNQHKVSKWKSALTKAANISGWDSRTHRDDSELIQNIVNDVLQKLHLRYPYELKGLIGVDEMCRDIESILKYAGAVGIWGMGGIGKTTLAKAIFSKHSHQYDSVCFLENVREQSTKLGLSYLRDKLLSILLNEQIPTSNDVPGSTFNKRRLRNKKVFLVLDDVDSFEQLEYLCGECGDLGPNSRLIITTRDMHLLIGRVDEIYAARTWEYPQSLHLFCLNAFKKSQPQKGYEALSARAVDYAGGIPLALKVLGSYLYSKSNEFWESELSKLEKYPNEKIQNVLRVSYDGLHKLEKDIFLDIAFFFKGHPKNVVTAILNSCDFYATSGIDVLVDKALITISYSNTIEMHDLLQKMGLDIVREEYGGDLGRRSRLTDTEEVCELLKNNKGTDAVEGITLDLSQVEEDLYLSADTFNNMTNLRFLEVHIPLGKTSGVVYHPRAFEQFSDKLRSFRWDGYPLKSLPPKFSAKFLIDISMPYSNVKELWQGMQDLVNLERIDFRGCKQLAKLPDLSRASKLKKVSLSDCESLCDLHPSILSLDSLIALWLDGCIKLKSLKSEKHLRSLKEVYVDGCSSLKEFSVSSDLIESLDLSETGVKLLHSSIGRLINLTMLDISNCIAVNKERLRVLFDGLRSLEYLHLMDCYNLSELPDNISLLSRLHFLELDGSSVERLPASIKHLQQLYHLSLKDCLKLKWAPELPPSIDELYADNCTSLVRVSLSTAKNFNAVSYVFSFKNCVKLVGRSFKGIMEEAMIAAFLNINRKVKVCMPGRKVPRQFKYRTEQSPINTELPSVPNLEGFIWSVVLSSLSPTMEECEIICKCCLANGTNVQTSRFAFTADFTSDHVFVWYDQSYDFNFNGVTVSFEFSVTGRHGGLIVMKECGVHLIYDSEFYSSLEWNLDDKVELGVLFGLKLDLHHMRWFHEMQVKDIVLKLLQLNWDVSLKYEHESGYKAILAAIKKKSKKSNEVVPESRSVLGELEMEFDKKVELGLKLGLALDMNQLGLALDMNQLYSELKDWQSVESLRLALFRAIVNQAQKSNEFVLESHSFLGELKLEFDEKVVMGVTLGLRLGWEQRMSKGIMLSKLWNILQDGLTIEKETQKSNEFVFSPLPTRKRRRTEHRA